MLGFSNTAVVDPRFDSNNQTLMSGGASGNVFAILNTGQFTNDETNANSFALIAGFIDQDTIELERLSMLMVNRQDQMVLLM